VDGNFATRPRIGRNPGFRAQHDALFLRSLASRCHRPPRYPRSSRALLRPLLNNSIFADPARRLVIDVSESEPDHRAGRLHAMCACRRPIARCSARFSPCYDQSQPGSDGNSYPHDRRIIIRSTHVEARRRNGSRQRIDRATRSIAAAPDRECGLSFFDGPGERYG